MIPDLQQHPRVRIENDGRAITTLEEWLEYAGPMGNEAQWVDERSAKELARAWVEGGPHVPAAVRELLETHPRFAGLTDFHARPEHRVKLDDFRGQTRNVDLLVVASGAGRRAVISIEAKADESFGPTIAERLEDADRALEATDGRSKARARVEQLALAVLGRRAEEVGALRYQMLHASAAAIAAAADEGAAEALMLVHEFRGRSANDDLLARNAADLAAFVDALSPGTSVAAGSIAGPFSVPGGGRVAARVPLYLGKLVSRC